MQQQILAAFGHRERPTTVTNVTVSSTLRDDAMRFEGKDWRDVTADDWLQNSDAFFGLSPEAFAYYLPSILSLSLDRANFPMGSADALIASLDTSADPEIWPEWFCERFGLLGASEVEALKDWAALYLANAEKGEGSEFARVQDTLSILNEQIVPGDLYEDCAYHPCLCVGVSEADDNIWGISLIDGSYPRSCSLAHCGVRKLGVEEAWEIKQRHIRRNGQDEWWEPAQPE